MGSGVARMLKKLRTSKRDYCIKQWFSTITSLFKMGTPHKGKNLHFYHIRWPPLNVTFSITLVRILRNGRYANDECSLEAWAHMR